MDTTIAIASDHAGVELKTLLAGYLRELGYAAEDLGTHEKASVDYADYANTLAAWIRGDTERKGILVCGSGIGVSIAANRHAHIRAALCQDGLMAELARRHNNANVLCLGARLIGVEVARECVRRFLAAEFEGGRHASRVEKLG